MPENTWDIIKAIICTRTPGTLGYQKELLTASDLFVHLMDRITDKARASDAFNDDREVTEALLNRPAITEILGA